MRHVHLLALGAFVAIVALVVQVGSAAAEGVRVTSSNDSRPGSFRAAVAAANTDSSIGQIVFVGGLAPIELSAPVVYTGAQSLGLIANGAVIEDQGFSAETSGDLSITGLTIRDAAGEGLTYEVPSSATGVVQVSLNGLTITGNAGHGVFVDAQTNLSTASLDVSVLNSVFADNGFGELDRDGLRVQEGGEGDLRIVVRNTTATGNGADGIELDERDGGDALFTVSDTLIADNGSFDVTEQDLDDGMDVDESGGGALRGRVSNSAADDNFEEGWDFNENDAGDFVVEMTNVGASRNLEEGIDFEEDDDFAGGGHLIATLVNVTTDENVGGDGGLKIREKGEGSLQAAVRDAHANGNETDGINAREDAAGDLVATIESAATSGNDGDGIEFEENGTGGMTAAVERSTNDGNTQDGVEFDENGAGDLAGGVRRGSASANGGYGVRAEQQLPGAGTLALIGVELVQNALGGALGVDVTVTQTP